MSTHTEQPDHEHLPDDGCETALHGDHVDHVHDGERHAETKVHAGHGDQGLGHARLVVDAAPDGQRLRRVLQRRLVVPEAQVGAGERAAALGHSPVVPQFLVRVQGPPRVVDRTP